MGFQKYRFGAASIGLMYGFSMCITLLGPSGDFRSGVTTWVGLDKQLSLGRVIGFSYEDPLVTGAGKPITVVLDKDPKTGAAIDPPQRAYVYPAGTKFSPGVNHPEMLGLGVQDLSESIGKIGSADIATGTVFTIAQGEFNGEEVNYIINASAVNGWTTDEVLQAAGDSNTFRVGQGKTIFVTEGCWWCHTMLPEQTQDWQAFGTPPFLGDMNGEMPTAFGSDRKGPDLLHVAARNSSREWMTMHFFNPRLVQPNSTMPRYDYLFGKTDIEGNTIDYDKWRSDYTAYVNGETIYPPEVPEPSRDSEVRALIDWILTSLR